ncbi:MAG: PKD domain-containing protein, partial [Bacteroidales bacterium]|nr:PKD domain-containing protein [Bacteroidales bacterium]
IKSSKTIYNQISENTDNTFITKPEIKKETLIAEKTELEQKSTKKITEIAPVEVLKSLKALSIIYGDSLKKLNLITFKHPEAKFTINSKSGCAPLNIEINNFSSNAFEYEWNFGDGGKSKLRNPEYTYRYSGSYKISLKATGFGGISYTIIDSITVFDKPKTKIFWPYSSPIYTNQKIIIQNESENVNNFEWSFGDETTSKEKTGIHTYTKEGNYNIVLRAWSSDNCFDSTIIKNVTILNANDQIIFPTAFTPNTDGPSSGNYIVNDYHNDIFHPITNVEIIEYNLKVFSKAGVLVFESNDIKIGWDGYYQNTKLPSGVYLYIASGKFENQQKFLKKGNVTIIDK